MVPLDRITVIVKTEGKSLERQTWNFVCSLDISWLFPEFGPRLFQICEGRIL